MPAEKRREKVYRMMDLIAHRGPDDEGVYDGEEACLGNRRLAIIDLSPSGHQPMHDDQSVLVFNGEIYNFKELRKELEGEGVKFTTRSDTEVLLRGFRTWGEEVVSRLNGMFAFAIWDGRKRQLFCARDPFGKKPFYFHWASGRFVFASEIEAVASALDRRPEPDYRGISHYLLKGYFPPGRSVYDSIDTLKAGHILKVDLSESSLSHTPYWRGRFELGRSAETSEIHTADACNELVGASIKRRFRSDVPVGVLLSGGVDSSLVTLLSSEKSGSEMQTFTVAFDESAYDESRYAAQVASRIEAPHTYVKISMDSLPKEVSRLVEVYGEPFGDYSAIPTYHLFEALKTRVKVALTGDGGDEVFAGYKSVKLFQFRAAASKYFPNMNLLGGSIADSLIYSRSRKLRQLGHALISVRPDGAEAFYSLYREGWTRHWRESMMRPEAWVQGGGSDLEQDEAQNFNNSGRDDLERYLNRSLERLTQLFLVKIDRASMAHSIEARCPLLDVDVFEWASGLPKDVLLRNGEPKSILKNQLSSWMGSDFTRRPKMGFTPPLSKWLREEGNVRWIEERLTNKESFAYSIFAPEQVRRLLQRHISGRDNTGRIWKLLFLNEWHSRFYGTSSENTNMREPEANAVTGN